MALNMVPGLSLVSGLCGRPLLFGISGGMSVSPVEQVLNPLYHCSRDWGPESISGAGVPLLFGSLRSTPTPNFTRSQYPIRPEIKLRKPARVGRREPSSVVLLVSELLFRTQTPPHRSSPHGSQG